MKIGMLGAGMIARTHAEMYRQMPGVELAAVALNQPDEFNALHAICPQVSAYPSLEDFFQSGIELVDICLPTFLHQQYIQASLEQGLPVICEKPLCRTIEEADELLEISQKYRPQVYVAHVIRFWPEYVYLRKTLQDQHLGALKSLTMGRYTSRPDWSVNDWLLKAPLSGGTSLDLQIHDVDFVLSILGEPAQVDVTCRKNNLHCWTKYIYAPDLTVVMEAGNDLPKSFGFEMQYQAIFEQGLLRFNSQQSPTLHEYTEQGERVVNLLAATAPKSGQHIPAGNAYYVELAHFIGCAQKNLPSEVVNLESAAQTVKMILKSLPKHLQ
ncbi:Gfo/Idh/MocA family oxidoreductase [candidate division KSB1 bacterium]|nr:Gfo/Idh/MocA family oxidoreductase [candidate division KSB1 bacterium]